ncbi:DUF1062 domain-containing protein [Sphingobacterium hungaricum]
MQTEFVLEVIVKNTPLLKRKCPNCNSDRFYCSDKFRINANKKNIDIWLIYRCIKCDNSYNLTLISRTKLASLNKELLFKFQENDKELAWKYAFSHETFYKSNVEPDFDSVQYVIYSEINLTDESILNRDDLLKFRIKYPYEFNLKISSILRTCLKLSTTKFNKLIELEGLYLKDKQIQKNCRIRNNDLVQIDMEKLKQG